MDPRPLTVVIDTNVWDKSAAATSKTWKRFRKLSREGLVRIVIPAVVKAEIERHIREDGEKCVPAINKAVRAHLMSIDASRAADLIEMAASVPPADELARDRLAELAADGVQFTTYPSVSHAEVVERDLWQRQPFKPNGEGYRDALIWHSVLEQASAAELVVFITNDSTGFCQDKKPDMGLAKALLAEVPQGSVVDFYSTLDDFLKHRFPSQLDAALRTPTSGSQRQRVVVDEADLAKRATEYSLQTEVSRAPRQAIATELSSSLEQQLVGMEVGHMFEDLRDGQHLPVDGLMVPREVTDLTIMHAEVDGASYDYSVVEAYEPDALIEGKFTVDVSVDGYITKSDYYGLTREESASIDVWDADWNEHVMWVQMLMRLEVAVGAFVDPEFGTVHDMTIEDAHFVEYV